MIDFETATKEYLEENPELSGDQTYEQTLEILEIQSKEELVEKFKKLDELLPIEERIPRLEKDKNKKNDDNDFFIGKPVTLKDLNPELTHKEWLWENFLAKRHITLLVAYWKAGKSTMLRALFAAMANGEEFAGEPTKRCKVLVITEEPDEDWVEKREEFSLEDNVDINIWSRPFKGKPTLKQWPEVIARLIEECKSSEIDLLVFDTISTFFPINREKDSDEWLNALIPLYEFTRLNVGVLLVHHFRKGAGEEAQAFRGSGVLGSFPSNIIEFIRDPEGFHYRRVLKTFGRFSQAMPRTLIELQLDMKYKTLGDPTVVSKIHRVAKVTTIIAESKTPLCAKDIVNIWATESKTMEAPVIGLRSVQNYLSELLTSGIIVLSDERVIGKQKVPFYALKSGFAQQKDMEFLYSTTDANLIPGRNDTPLSFVNELNSSSTNENSTLNNTITSLSSVNLSHQITTDETKGISVSQEDKKEREDPPF